MKIPNSVSQKMRVLLKTDGKKKISRNVGKLKSVIISASVSCTRCCVGQLVRPAVASTSLGFCSGARAQLVLIGPFSSSALLSVAFLIFILTTPHGSSMWRRSGEGRVKVKCLLAR